MNSDVLRILSGKADCQLFWIRYYQYLSNHSTPTLITRQKAEGLEALTELYHLGTPYEIQMLDTFQSPEFLTGLREDSSPYWKQGISALPIGTLVEAVNAEYLALGREDDFGLIEELLNCAETDPLIGIDDALSCVFPYTDDVDGFEWIFDMFIRIFPPEEPEPDHQQRTIKFNNGIDLTLELTPSESELLLSQSDVMFVN